MGYLLGFTSFSKPIALQPNYKDYDVHFGLIFDNLYISRFGFVLTIEFYKIFQKRFVSKIDTGMTETLKVNGFGLTRTEPTTKTNPTISLKSNVLQFLSGCRFLPECYRVLPIVAITCYYLPCLFWESCLSLSPVAPA